MNSEIIQLFRRCWIPLLLVSLLLGCGEDEGAGSGSGSGTTVADAPCAPVNPELRDESQTEIQITAVDYGYEPAALEIPDGITTFVVSNEGAEPHELAFLPGGGAVPFTADGEPDEAALEERGAFELEGFAPGLTCDATYNLEPGSYTLFCIIQTPEGVTHYEEGMRATLTVSG